MSEIVAVGLENRQLGQTAANQGAGRRGCKSASLKRCTFSKTSRGNGSRLPTFPKEKRVFGFKFEVRKTASPQRAAHCGNLPHIFKGKRQRLAISRTEKQKKMQERGRHTPSSGIHAKICLARLFLRACETRDFGGSRIAVSRTRKPIHLDRSDWLFEVGDLLRSLERFWDLESSIPSFRIPKFGSLAWLTLADVLLQPCYKGS